MQVRLNFMTAVLAFALATSRLTAQQVVSQSSVERGPVYLSVVVTGAHDKAVSALTQQDFTLLDNSVQRPITSFREVHAAQEPVNVLIFVDAVNTPYTALSFQRDQIVKYLRANEGQLAHVTSFVVLTDKGAQIYAKPSKDGIAISNDLEHYEIGLRVIGRDQGFYGATDRLTISLNALREITAFEAKASGRKLVFWVSPGWPLLSGAEVVLDGKQQQQIYGNIASTSTQLRDAGITLYSVDSWGAGENLSRALYYQEFTKGVSKPGQTQLGDLGLQVLAEQSGGLVMNSSSVVDSLQKCVADADEYYVVSFDPPPSEKANEFHQIEVRVDKPGLKVRTRQSYYTAP